MKRYQVYLNQQSVRTLDIFEKEIKLSRSGIIRLAVDALAKNLILALPAPKAPVGLLDDLVGIITPATKKPTNMAVQVDDIYLSD